MGDQDVNDRPSYNKSQQVRARTRGVKSNPTTIDEQRAELEEYRYKLDMFESRLRNSSFMDPEDRRTLREQAKEAREHLRKLEWQVNRIHRKSQKSFLIIFTIFTLFITLYIFLMVKTIWKDEKNSERIT
ncbi:uncharacterized protein LOC111258907 [Varroa jacobsoni]|uniref:uncharacterized protein LOC111258907 n=1 Tax=Varroa jacobsoni TaxID=62625 RepID=UPI000BF865D9|nr:uncharacterized protein LOC111258907 [Varroa jacobsoni]